jgi:Na+/melibiose symporter-like transporter
LEWHASKMASKLVDEKITHNSKSMDPEVQDSSHGDAPGRTSDTYPSDDDNLIFTPQVPLWRIVVSLILLLLNYFLAQYDKFILSYFQDSVVSSLDLSLSEYGIISGYATGIVYALLALPMAFVADYTSARLWVLSIAAVWWSLCAIFQGFSHSFVQLFLARIGMGIGQAAVEPLSVSLISDMLGKDYVFIGERCALPILEHPALGCPPASFSALQVLFGD